MKNYIRGKFITFEGCDGCGKSTQLKMFADYLSANKIPHIFTREPGGGKISECIREIILDGRNGEMVQHIHDRVEPALKEGKIVICDRYIDSSFAYQAYARGLGFDFIADINSYAVKNYLPDLTIFIDLSPEEAFSRKHGADENDRMEQAGAKFHARVYEGYKKLLKEYPDRIRAVDGRKTPNEVFEEILSALKEKCCL